MSISSINTSSLYAARYGLDFNNLNGGSQSTTSTAAAALRAAGNSYTTSTAASGVISTLGALLSGMGLGSSDKVTFQDLLNYREDLRQNFETTVKKGLREKGVDEDVKFQVVSDGNGGVKIITDSPDKAKIEAYFADNPKLVEQFNQIEALTNVEAARKNSKLDVKAMRQRIEVESMTAWFTGSGQSVGSILNFSGAESALLSAGLNQKV